MNLEHFISTADWTRQASTEELFAGFCAEILRSIGSEEWTQPPGCACEGPDDPYHAWCSAYKEQRDAHLH